MAPPSALTIAAQSVQRLVKEETYYHKELEGQEKRISKLQEDIQNQAESLDQNADFVLKQEVRARFLNHLVPNCVPTNPNPPLSVIHSKPLRPRPKQYLGHCTIALAMRCRSWRTRSPFPRAMAMLRRRT